MAQQEFDPNELLVFSKMLAALGVSPVGFIRTALAAEEALAAYASRKKIALSSEGRVEIPEEGLADALREVPEALAAPTFIRRVMFLRALAANPSESLWSNLTEEGLGFIYQAAGPDAPTIPHSHRDGSTAWNLTKQTKDRLDREAEADRLEDLPLGAPLGEMAPAPAVPPGPDLTRVLAALRRLAKALAKPRKRYAFLDEAKLHQAIALNDRRRILMAERMLTETESWGKLAAELPRRKGGKSRHADAIRKFVDRMFRLNREHPERFRMAYKKGGISPALLKAIDDAEKANAVDNLIQVLRRRAASQQA